MEIGDKIAKFTADIKAAEDEIAQLKKKVGRLEGKRKEVKEISSAYLKFQPFPNEEEVRSLLLLGIDQRLRGLGGEISRKEKEFEEKYMEGYQKGKK